MSSSTRTGLIQIGDVADRTGLSVRMIRHYEEVGLLSEAERSAGRFRLYTDEVVARLLLSKRMKPLEFSLEEMRDLIEVRDRLTSPRLSAKTRDPHRTPDHLPSTGRAQAHRPARTTRQRTGVRRPAAQRDQLTGRTMHQPFTPSPTCQGRPCGQSNTVQEPSLVCRTTHPAREPDAPFAHEHDTTSVLAAPRSVVNALRRHLRGGGQKAECVVLPDGI